MGFRCVVPQSRLLRCAPFLGEAMKTMIVGLGLASVLLASCGAALPPDDEVKAALTEPVLSHASYNGVGLPRDAVSMAHIDILSIVPVTTSNTPHYKVEANAALVLVKNGNEIGHEVAGNGIAGIFALQQFTRSLGFALKSGQGMNFKVHADLVKDGDHYSVDDGTVEPL